MWHSRAAKFYLGFKNPGTSIDAVTHVKLIRIGLVCNMFQLANELSIFSKVKIAKLH